jgi:hypothetical protein
MPNPWVHLRCDQLILVNKAVDDKEYLEKGLEEEGEEAPHVPIYVCNSVEKIVFLFLTFQLEDSGLVGMPDLDRVQLRQLAVLVVVLGSMLQITNGKGERRSSFRSGRINSGMHLRSYGSSNRIPPGYRVVFL